MQNVSPVQVETALTAKWIERNASVKIVQKLTDENYQKLSKFPEKPAFKRDLGETILVMFEENGI